MGIRRYKKDHLRELAPALVEVPAEAIHLADHDPLVFWTKHDHPTLVNLHVFADGNDGVPESIQGHSRPARTFAGRAALIAELAPALCALLEYAAPSTARQYLQALRDWWRLFDAIEGGAVNAEVTPAPVHSVGDIGELHRQRAFDDNMDPGAFGSVLRVINIVRKTKGMRPLPWRRPELKRPSRHLPPEWQVREVRLALKHGWFATLDRWQTAEDLLAGRPPKDEEEQRLLMNYVEFGAARARTKHPRPSAVSIWNGMHPRTFSGLGFNVPDMLRGHYPDAEDIRYAFHLCLASTGWNPSVLLALNADSAFIETHPKDPTRYLLRGYKARSRTEQHTEGLYKSQGSAGVILQTLLSRTRPLREQLRKDLRVQEAAYQEMLHAGGPAKALDAQRKLVAKLRIGVSSLWLYAAQASDEIVWLDPYKATYARGLNRVDNTSFLDELVARLNVSRPKGLRLATLKAGDFRDAFAAYAYRISGGMVLYVMKALGHKSIGSTQKYLDNTLLNDQSIQLYLTFSNAMWTQIKVHQRLDPTIIAKCSRDGDASAADRERLESYRSLRRSRIGVGCKDPHHPPSHIAPNFRADGKAMCHVHRCMLCLEHAVIFPDSLSGLAKRLAELRAIHRRMSVVAFLESSFREEMENTELALRGFDIEAVTAQVEQWEGRISDGIHRVVELDGFQVMA